MSQFPDRHRSALLVVDVQVDVVAEAHDRDGVVARVRDLVDEARTADVPVVWVQDTLRGGGPSRSGSAGWQVVPELEPGEGEPRIEKDYGDAFEATGLGDVLSDLGVGRVVVVGAQTDACVRATLHGAFVRGYDVTLVSDAHTTEDLTAYGAPPPAQVVAHTNLYWQFQGGPDRTADVVAAADVAF
ncbi:isochorismatase family protein [Aeromicrobium sp. CnD17-E]|uniref:isochorismatase family protein n=1 Tax=Aeromicrobium sp. CnD17-E TaxID=2954487 RepID=UPI00209794F7|nr:isochorismatase family protein [Aeromicrobium sp. CnD17-E]MCO7240380.1 isochorismatase family protein [Aeromicrobium sp. CnD17-E]